MGESIHLYKLLESSEEQVPVQIPDTVIYGFGFHHPTLIIFSSHLKFSILSEESALSIISNLSKNHKVLQKTASETKEIHELPQKLPNETVFQLKIIGKPIKVLWTNTKGYSHTDQPPKLHHQFDFIKSIINKKALSNINSRLSRLEIEFIITAKGKIYCLAITKYQYSEIKFLSYFQSLNTTSMQKSLPKSPILFPLTPDPVKNLGKKNKTKTTSVLGDKLSSLMQNSESIKYMRYSQWKLAVDSGNKLLSNEQLYSKKLAGISTRVLVQSTKNVKEMRKMAGIMRKSLHRRESYIDANEIAKLRDNMFIDNYIINLNEGRKSRKKSQKNIKKTIKLIIDDASNKLDSLKSKSISHRFDLGKT